MTFRFHPDAATEFAEEIYATIFRVLKFPEAGASLSANTRRCLANRFPYGLVYQVKSDGLRIIAVRVIGKTGSKEGSTKKAAGNPSGCQQYPVRNLGGKPAGLPAVECF
jgi:plasmid stabilization system protein ParE